MSPQDRPALCIDVQVPHPFSIEQDLDPVPRLLAARQADIEHAPTRCRACDRSGAICGNKGLTVRDVTVPAGSIATSCRSLVDLCQAQ
jgi:hypothetical protein